MISLTEAKKKSEREKKSCNLYRSKKSVSSAFLLYNVSNKNVQRLKDFHHSFFAFHSLLWFFSLFIFSICVYFGSVFCSDGNAVLGRVVQRHNIIVKLRINSFKHFKMKFFFHLSCLYSSPTCAL